MTPFRLQGAFLGAALLLAFAAAGCSLTDISLAGTSAVDGGPTLDARLPVDATPLPIDAATFEARPIVSLPGLPAVVGCSDGTREGFLDVSLVGWPRIAGCSGAWQRPGLTVQAVAAPQCGRQAGNSGILASGLTCGAADLCAQGWHVCRGPFEVDRLSPSQCEAIVGPGVSAFFAVAGGGGVGGECALGEFGPGWNNDVRGCGSIGQAEAEGCYPLDRRLEFHDCLATNGAWLCGSADQHDREVLNVSKATGELGGVLCCRDEP